MIAQEDIKSGHDLEILFGEEYIQYILLSAVDTGDFPLSTSFDFDSSGITTTIDLSFKVPETIRRDYSPQEISPPVQTTALNAFGVQIIEDGTETDLLMSLIADVTLTLGALSPTTYTDVELRIEAAVDLGGSSGTSLSFVISSVMTDNDGLNAILTNPQIQSDTIQNINDLLGTSLNQDLFGDSSSLQSISMRKYTDNEEKRALGFYLNMIWKTGFEDEDIASERGNIDLAVNFLPEGQHFAFGLNPNMFSLMSEHLRIMIADEMNEDNEDFYLFLDGKEIGYLKAVEVDVVKDRYDIGPGEKSEPTQAIRIKAKINSVVYGSDVAISYFLFPVLQDDRLIQWEIRSEVNVDLLMEFVPIFIIFFCSILSPALGLLVGQFLSIALLSASGFASDYISGELESGNDLSQTDSIDAFTALLPQRIEISKRRWDPFYQTSHQLLVPFDFFELEDDGMVACGQVQLSNQPIAIKNVLIRDERRNNSEITDLLYRVSDYKPSRADYSLVVLATDRRNWTEETGDAEANILSIGIDEAKVRAAEGRIKNNVFYRAQAVDIRKNQVQAIKVISETEMSEGGNSTARLDLSPREMGDFQISRLLFLRNFDLVIRQGVPYYRDVADRSTADNLMSMPRYKSLDLL